MTYWNFILYLLGCSFIAGGLGWENQSWTQAVYYFGFGLTIPTLVGHLVSLKPSIPEPEEPVSQEVVLKGRIENNPLRTRGGTLKNV